MFTTIVELLATPRVNVDVLKFYLCSLRHPKTEVPYIDPAHYQECNSTMEVLRYLREHLYIHPLQTYLLKKIVDRYGCDKCKRLLAEYELELNGPLKQLRYELSDEEINAILDAMKLRVELRDEDVDTLTLEGVRKIQVTLENNTGISRDVIIYAKIEPGSVLVTFLIPRSVPIRPFTEISIENKPQLLDLDANGIVSIEVEGIKFNIQDLLHRITVSKGSAVDTVSKAKEPYLWIPHITASEWKYTVNIIISVLPLQSNEMGACTFL